MRLKVDTSTSSVRASLHAPRTGMKVLKRCHKFAIGVAVLIVMAVTGRWHFNLRLHAETNNGLVVPETLAPPSSSSRGVHPLHSDQWRFLQEEAKRNLNQVKHTPTESEVLSNTVPTPHSDSEIDTVLQRMDRCLVSTNMTSYFRSHRYYNRAQINARHLLEGLRKTIPTFTVPYDVPCWHTSFLAVQQSPISMTGSIGTFHFHFVAHNHIFKDVHWSRRGKEMYVKQSVACLPKIFLLGYPKCGSTFLYCLIRKVLRLALNIQGSCEVAKEPHWWIVPGPRNVSQSPSADSVALYLLNFYKGAQYRERNMSAVTIDSSPNLMFHWPRYSDDETMENYCLIPSVLPTVLPDSKYFVVMRNPISMLYSAFWFSCTMLGNKLSSVKYKGPDIFHKRITTKIRRFNDCKNRGKPLDECVDIVAPNLYSSELPNCGRTRLEMGLYYFHTRKWLSVVPLERIHFFTLEELGTQDLTHSAHVILDHLEISSKKMKFHESDLQCNENPQKMIDYKHDPRLMMREDTRQFLVEFFQPYNQMLADLLGDEKFLWS